MSAVFFERSMEGMALWLATRLVSAVFLLVSRAVNLLLWTSREVRAGALERSRDVRVVSLMVMDLRVGLLPRVRVVSGMEVVSSVGKM